MKNILYSDYKKIDLGKLEKLKKIKNMYCYN